MANPNHPPPNPATHHPSGFKWSHVCKMVDFLSPRECSKPFSYLRRWHPNRYSLQMKKTSKWRRPQNEGVSRVFQGNFKGCSKEFFGVFLGSFKGVPRKIKGGFNGVLRGFQGCWKEFQWVFQQSFKGVSRKFQVCFKEVLRVLKGRVRGVLRGL